MDTTAQVVKNLPSNLDPTKVADMRAIIYDDNTIGNRNIYQIEFSGTIEVAEATNQVGITRFNGGIFDSTNFNDTTVNRGYLKITYTV